MTARDGHDNPRNDGNRAEDGPRIVAGNAGADHPVRIRIGEEVILWRPGETLIQTLMAHWYGRRGRREFLGCRRGGCGACKLHLDAGVVALRHDYSRDVLEDGERAAGRFLACRAYPLTDLTVRLVPRRNVFFELYGRHLERGTAGREATQPVSDEVRHG